MDYSYHVYGLNLRSEIRLPEVDVPAQGRTDVEIYRGAVRNKPTADDSASWGCYHATSRTANLYYPQIGFFEITDGRHIVVEARQRVRLTYLRHVILTIALSIALDQRDHLTFHASAVNVNGRVVAFLGGKQSGKTAIAAAFFLQNYPLVTDNALVLQSDRVTTVLPGYARLKLRPDTLAEMPDLNGALMENYTGNHKLMQADEGFTASPLSLDYLFVLDWGAEPGIEPLSLRQSFVRLIQYSYALRFLGKAGATAKHFTRINQLVHAVPVSVLRRPRDSARLSKIVDVVVSHLQSGEAVNH